MGRTECIEHRPRDVAIERDGLEGCRNTQTSFFRSFADGTWKFEAEGAAPDCGPDNGFLDPFCGYTATGIDGTWIVTTPEPSAIVLVATVLGGLGVCAWRRSRFRRSSGMGT